MYAQITQAVLSEKVKRLLFRKLISILVRARVKPQAAFARINNMRSSTATPTTSNNLTQTTLFLSNVCLVTFKVSLVNFNVCIVETNISLVSSKAADPKTTVRTPVSKVSTL